MNIRRWVSVGMSLVAVSVSAIVLVIALQMTYFRDQGGFSGSFASFVLVLMFTLPALGVGVIILMVAGIASLIRWSRREKVAEDKSPTLAVPISPNRRAYVWYGIAVGAIVVQILDHWLPIGVWSMQHIAGMLFLLPLSYVALLAPFIVLTAVIIGAGQTQKQSVKLQGLVIALIMLVIFLSINM